MVPVSEESVERFADKLGARRTRPAARWYCDFPAAGSSGATALWRTSDPRRVEVPNHESPSLLGYDKGYAVWLATPWWRDRKPDRRGEVGVMSPDSYGPERIGLYLGQFA